MISLSNYSFWRPLIMILLEYCSEPRCYFKDFETNSDKNDYIVLPTYNSVALNDEVSLSCTADPKNIKQLKYYCNSDGRFEPSPLEKLCKPSNIWIPATSKCSFLIIYSFSSWIFLRSDEWLFEKINFWARKPEQKDDTKIYKQSCAECYLLGTDQCLQIETEKVQCLCKTGWSVSCFIRAFASSKASSFSVFSFLTV